MQLTIVGNPENRRVTLFCEAAQRLGLDAPTIMPYEQLLSGKEPLNLRKGTTLKIESPGENPAVRALLTGQNSAYNNGQIANIRSWYAGYSRWLDECQKAIDEQRCHVMNTPEDIKLQFDKPRCQEHLEQHGIAVPKKLPALAGYDDLQEKMRDHNLYKVFIKPAHASSASGVIAFRKAGAKVQAITSAELVHTPTGIKLYNSLTVRTYTKEPDIAALVDHLAAENIFAEEWLPKATLDGRFFDIRVLVIAGKSRHTVLRTSKNIITNLHLGNKRGDLQEFIDTIGEQKLNEIKKLAEDAAACFPRSLYMGVDVLLGADLRKTAVLEINAFGDLLPGLIDEGETCYEAEIKAMIRRTNQWKQH